MNEATDAALVSAARVLFAEHGFDATSVRQITGAANANLGAITYHFGSKRALYDRVLESVVQPLAARVELAVTRPAPLRERVAAVVRTYFDYLAENPDLPRLMIRELVQAGGPSAVVAEPMLRIQRSLMALVTEGHGTGEVVAGPAALQGIFIMSVPVHLGLLRTALHTHLHVDVWSPEHMDAAVNAAVNFVTRGMFT